MDLAESIKVRVVKDPTYRPTLHLQYKGGIPVDPELWVNQTLAADPAALRKYLEWAWAEWNSVSNKAA